MKRIIPNCGVNKRRTPSTNEVIESPILHDDNCGDAVLKNISKYAI
jgi:hypothetical protein